MWEKQRNGEHPQSTRTCRHLQKAGDMLPFRLQAGGVPLPIAWAQALRNEALRRERHLQVLDNKRFAAKDMQTIEVTSGTETHKQGRAAYPSPVLVLTSCSILAGGDLGRLKKQGEPPRQGEARPMRFPHRFVSYKQVYPFPASPTPAQLAANAIVIRFTS